MAGRSGAPPTGVDTGVTMTSTGTSKWSRSRAMRSNSSLGRIPVRLQVLRASTIAITPGWFSRWATASGVFGLKSAGRIVRLRVAIVSEPMLGTPRAGSGSLAAGGSCTSSGANSGTRGSTRPAALLVLPNSITGMSTSTTVETFSTSCSAIGC